MWIKVGYWEDGKMGRREDARREDGKMDCVLDLADCGGLCSFWRIVHVWRIEE